jgi:hypothetical protein
MNEPSRTRSENPCWWPGCAEARWPVEVIDAVANTMPGRRDAARNVLAKAIRALMDAGDRVRPRP